LHDIALTASPLAPGRSPVHIRVRDAGAGPPIVFLRSGWGTRSIPSIARPLRSVATGL